MTQRNARSRLFQAVNLVLATGTVSFAFVYGRDLLAKADFSHLSERGWLLGLAAILFGFSYLLGAWHWLRTCRLVDKDTPPRQMMSFFASQPFKYLPSSVFTFSYRAKFAQEMGLTIKKSSLAQLIENASLIASGIATSVVFSVLSYSFWLGGILALSGLAVVFLVVRSDLTVPVFRTGRRISARPVVASFLLMVGGWTLAGIAFLLVSYSLDLSVDPWLMISANAAAYVVSMFAVFAPGGIGVREVTLSLFSVGSSVIVLWRLLTLVADMALGLGTIVVLRVTAHRG